MTNGDISASTIPILAQIQRSATRADEMAQDLRYDAGANLRNAESALTHAQRVVLDAANGEVENIIGQLQTMQNDIDNLLSTQKGLVDATLQIAQAVEKVNQLLGFGKVQATSSPG